jgi:glycosyltransferase involved in cell wall biosynthesis
VQLAGWQPAGALRALYDRADAFVLASTRESFGIAALEAAAAGLPVVAMRDSGCREFVGTGEGGYLCADDAELTRVMAHLMIEPPRGSPDAGRLDRYDWSNVLAAHETAYAHAIRRAAPSSVPT